MKLFDANVYIGRWPNERLAHHSADELCASMHSLSIARALVTHTAAWQNSPAIGNQMLMEAIAGHPQLEPCWVATPGLCTADEGGAVAFCDKMAQQGVRAVRLYPRDHVYSLTDRMSVELLTELNRHRFLILLDLDQIFTQSGLYDYSAGSLEVLNVLCRNYPDASILLTKVGYRAFHILFPLMQVFPNLYLDLSFLATHQGVETIVNELGAHRLVFGTGQPLVDAGGALLRLKSTDIPEESLQKISSSNLERLLSRVQIPLLPRQQSLSISPAEDHQPLGLQDIFPAGVEITDAHVHMGPYHKFYVPQNSAEEMLRVMDRLHIAQSCVSSHLAITGDWHAGNRLTAGAVSTHPERFIGHAVISPNEPELIEDELKRAFDDWGFKAIKLVPDTHAQPIHCEGYRPAFEFAARRRCPVLVHTYHGSSFDDPQLFGAVAARYPAVPIVMVHTGALPAAFEGAIRLAKEHANLYLDISGSFITGVWIRRMVAELGAERVIFSSDQPFIDPCYSLGRLLYAGLSNDALALVVGGNIRRLLNTAA